MGEGKRIPAKMQNGISWVMDGVARGSWVHVWSREGHLGPTGVRPWIDIMHSTFHRETVLNSVALGVADNNKGKFKEYLFCTCMYYRKGYCF